ncbi:hypothetical protein QQP08_026698 [Theobroma cacao]|nr:hypothetical protein QQP08_026698 [Theobroma cacao]
MGGKRAHAQGLREQIINTGREEGERKGSFSLAFWVSENLGDLMISGTLLELPDGESICFWC